MKSWWTKTYEVPAPYYWLGVACVTVLSVSAFLRTSAEILALIIAVN